MFIIVKYGLTPVVNAFHVLFNSHDHFMRVLSAPFYFQRGLQLAQGHPASKLKSWHLNQAVGAWALYPLNSLSRNHIQG